MPKVIVKGFAISLNGFRRGPSRDFVDPLGVGGRDLMNWFSTLALEEKCTARMAAKPGIDHQMAKEGFANIGA